MAKLKSKNGTPVLPSGSQYKDPTKQTANRKRAFSDTNSRYVNIKKSIVDLIKGLPRVKANIGYEFTVDDDFEIVDDGIVIDTKLMSEISDSIEDILEENLLEQTPTGDNWVTKYTDSAYEDGMKNALQSAKNVTSSRVVGDQLSRKVRSMQPEMISISPGYQRRVSLSNLNIFRTMKNLTDTTRNDLVRILQIGLEDGQSVNDIVKNIVARTDVSRSRAYRIVRTEINQSYRTAAMEESIQLNNDVYRDSAFELRSLWFSALSSTTRREHGRRHGRVYTFNQVRKFYNKGANAINCYCSQTQVLVNKETGEVLQSDLQTQMSRQREMFEEESDLFG